jgi:tRNA (cytidine/uridine-2'-O-)-methyltransferase
VHPEIHWNTGNAGRTCLAAGAILHLIEPLGFSLEEREVKRAGLDYWEHVRLSRHVDLGELYASLPDSRFLYLTTKTDRPYYEWKFADGDCLVFGRETRGLPETLLAANADRCLTIPMQNENVRSLNLATSVGIVLYEAIRQLS